MAAGVRNLSGRQPPDTSDAPISLTGRWLAVRDRLLQSERFQRFSASFPLTRMIARRQARALFDVCAGFVYSQILFACVRLDVFRRLAGGPKTLTELSRELALPLAETERLMLAAVSLRLLEKRGPQRFGLGMLGAAVNGNPGISAMVLHHDMLYRDLTDPVALLRGEGDTTELAQYWAYARSAHPDALDAHEVAKYSALMASSQSFIARDLLDAYPFDRHRCLLDVGGGEGAFITAAAARCPKLKFKLFDLPAVVERARSRFTGALAARTDIHAGSFISDRLPEGADVASLIRVVHDHDDATVMALLRAVHSALPVGGSIVVAEPMAGVSGAEPIGDAYFGMYLLAMGRGRARQLQEVAGMLEAAGFTGVSSRETRRPMLVSVVSGKRTSKVVN